MVDVVYSTENWFTPQSLQDVYTGINVVAGEGKSKVG